jgi:hypothetical protein
MRATALVLLLAAAAPAWAQAQGPAPAEGASTPIAASEPSSALAQVDATKLGVSLSRIQRGLRVSEVRERSTAIPIKLEFQVQVYGTAPRIDFIQDFDISPDAAIPYGAPTHAEFLRHWTPQAYRAPMVPFSNIAWWAIGELSKRSQKSRCEQEIADYRALVMQGISTAAPRCSQ